MYIGQVAELLKKHEGLCLKPYRCTAGKLTIGYGRNIEDNGISQTEAEQMLYNDIQTCYGECSKFGFWNKLNEARQAALIDMCFNLGISRLKQFKKMLAAVDKGDYKTASKEMLDSNWARQVKSRSTELAQIMEKGELLWRVEKVKNANK